MDREALARRAGKLRSERRGEQKKKTKVDSAPFFEIAKTGKKSCQFYTKEEEKNNLQPPLLSSAKAASHSSPVTPARWQIPGAFWLEITKIKMETRT